MEEGETGAEIQDQGLAQATAASESRDATEKDGAGNQDSEEENLNPKPVFPWMN